MDTNPQTPATAEVAPTTPTTEMTKPRSQWAKRVFGLLAACGALSVSGAFAFGVLRNPFAEKAEHKNEQAHPATKLPTAKVIKPKRAASVPITVSNIATVEPYYRADLRARTSGIVRKVHHDIGEKVKKGETLIEIDSPELDQDVARADAIILQRQQELKVSEAKVKDARALKDVSAATVKQRLADVEAAVATRDLKKRKFERFKDLAKTGSVVGSVVEEEERDYLSSEAMVNSAKANVERARADFAESESRVEAALADIDLKNAQIVVARKELDRAKAVADYAKITAPFDGVVIRRNVDPGSFVQNATTGASEVLISVAKVDLLTVSARFPDSVAPFVTDGTECVVQIDDMPGVSISSKVTRFAPSVQNADRTMRVEIDLFNGDDEGYRKLLEAIKTGGPDRPTKGIDDPAPVRAFDSGMPSTRRLLPGMTGSLTLTIGGFGESYVLPSSAIYTRGGASYLLLVENGKTREVSVRVQLNDGNTTRVAILTKRADAKNNTREVLMDLTGAEAVVAARQAEFGSGTVINPAFANW